MNKKTLIVVVALIAQIAAIGWLIWRYERIVSQGTEVRFACQAYDPHDPLRGRYLRTSVREDCTNMAFQVCETNRHEFRNQLFARLKPDGTNGLWQVAEVAVKPGGEGLWVRPKGSFIDYRLEWSARKPEERWGNFNQRQKASGLKAVVTFPDQLFVNEKLAPEAEKTLRQATGKSEVAVYRVLNGEMVITDIEIDGKSIVAAAGTEARRPRRYDLVIYGSSPAAVTAAVKARDMGLRPVIVTPAKHIGGLSISGLGFTDAGNTSAIGGLARDFYRRIYRAYQSPVAWKWQRREEFSATGQDTKAMDDAEQVMWIFEPHIAEQVFSAWLKERQIEVHRGEFLCRGIPGAGVIKERGRIVAIKTLAGKVYRGKYFIDATYEGDLMAEAGVPYRVGREDCAEFGEQWNGNQVGVLHHLHHFRNWGISPYRVPGDKTSGLCAEVDTSAPGERGKGDKRVQAYCYRLCLTDDARNRMAFTKPEGYDPARYELLARCYAKGYDETFWKFDRIANHKTDTNNHGPMNMDYLGGSYEWPEASYARREELAREHRDYQLGLCYYLANDPAVPAAVREAMAKWGLAKDEFVDNGGWPYELYVREGRRMIGAYTMTEHDCLGKARHPAQGRAYGPVGMGSYAIDSHNVRRYVTAEGYVQNEGDIEVRPEKPYGIDYGAIIPRKADCENLLVPVALSATHTAFGSIRMEPVFMLLGEAAATAAAQALAAGVAVQDIPYAPLAARLRADGQKLP